jgi:hypothetical protein
MHRSWRTYTVKTSWHCSSLVALGSLVVVGSERIVNQAHVISARTLDVPLEQNKDPPEGYRYMPLIIVYKVRRVIQDAGGTDPTIIPCNI